MIVEHSLEILLAKKYVSFDGSFCDLYNGLPNSTESLCQFRW